MHILVLDDEKNMRTVLQMLLERDGYTVTLFEEPQKLLKWVKDHPSPDLVITDFQMPEMDGLNLIRVLRKDGCSFPIIMITAYGSIEKAVEAMKIGATDFITKPFKKDIIRQVVHTALGKKERQVSTPVKTQSTEGMIFRSSVMMDIMILARKIAPTSASILLLGESGTGKGQLAREIHKMSGAESSPFVTINCPAVPENLLESEMFGYRKGAFTGANKDFPGKVSQADTGILFLDEVADLPLMLQPKLLKLLEEKTYDPLGSTISEKADIRIICATNKNLKELVSRGQFREDLYYRINTFTIQVPSLKERSEDIIPIADYFIHQFCNQTESVKSMSQEFQEVLLNYPWPGNVRELRNTIERAVILSDEDLLNEQTLPQEIRQFCEHHSPGPTDSTDNHLEATEKQILIRMLKKYEGNASATARALGITRNTLRYRLKKHNIAPF